MLAGLGMRLLIPVLIAQDRPKREPIFTAPFPRDKDFVPREDKIAEIKERLEKDTYGRVALVGLGGVG